MADLSITSSQVQEGDGAVTGDGIAGEAIDAGELVYEDTASTRLKLADADALATATVRGIALNDAAEGQPLTFLDFGECILGAAASVGVGTPYFLSTTAGKLAPITDLGSGDFVCFIGIGTAADRIQVRILNSGVAVA